MGAGALLDALAAVRAGAATAAGMAALQEAPLALAGLAVLETAENAALD